MSPVSIAVLLVGYSLALPIALKLKQVVYGGHRLAFYGHQLGLVLALIGWLLRGRPVLAAITGLWLLGARIWFAVAGNRPMRPEAPRS